jgi:hypothetical protein
MFVSGLLLVLVIAKNERILKSSRSNEDFKSPVKVNGKIKSTTNGRI